MPAERRVADGVQVASFSERDYPGGIRWYVAYPISYRQLEEMMQKRGVSAASMISRSKTNWW